MLEIKDLRVHYGKAEAIKQISLNVDEGAIVTLIGANGAGKTTTLRTISGLKVPTSGEIWFKGRRIDGRPPNDIVKLGIAHIPEGRMVFAPMTVFDNLRMGAYLRKDKHEILRDIETMYEHFPILKERKGQKAGQLSGGEQQMLAIARALMARPKLLLMDEPSMGLSPLLVEEVGDIISQINKGGISVLLVEQNAHMALELAIKAYIIEVGNITLQGAAHELASHERVKQVYLGA
ncbi:MAG: ABC transporter ATP-binding protein [Thermodesulfobacteriota bacterium]|jgi:branched-chain amino acid transport system ATP-binding protein